MGSRGCLPEELQENSCWWNGPEWLSKNEDEWPENVEVTQEEVTQEAQPEQTQQLTTLVVNHDQREEVIDVTGHSILHKLESVVSRILILVNKAKKRPDLQRSVLKKRH